MRFFWLLLVALGLGTKRHWHIFFALVLGIGLGLLFHDPRYVFMQDFFDIVGQVFIRLIKMLVIPLVVSSLVVGVSALGDGRQLGRMGSKVIILSLFLMITASLIGGALSLTIKPGEGLLPVIQSAVAAHGGPASEVLADIHRNPPELRELFFSMIPDNPVKSLANADTQLVPVIVFTMLFAAAIALIGEAGKPLVSFFESVFTATMKLTDWVMILSVPGVFSLAFVTVARSGPEIFIKLAPFILVMLLGMLLQVFIVFPLLLRLLAKIDFINLYRAVSEAIMVAFGTASSSATLPVTIACCERRAGISNRIASFVLPTGATINKTGTTLFEVVGVIFLLQAYNITLDPYTLVVIFVVAIIASLGTPAVPSAGLFTMVIVFNSIGVSSTDVAAGIGILWVIDRALDMCRTVVNVIGSCTVAALVASSEGELNRDVLNNRDAWVEVV